MAKSKKSKGLKWNAAISLCILPINTRKVICKSPMICFCGKTKKVTKMVASPDTIVVAESTEILRKELYRIVDLAVDFAGSTEEGMK